jgi:hypothetical protein
MTGIEGAKALNRHPRPKARAARLIVNLSPYLIVNRALAAPATTDAIS